MLNSKKKKRIFQIAIIAFCAFLLFTTKTFAFNDDGTTLPAEDIAYNPQPTYTPPAYTPPANTQPIVTPEPATEPQTTKNPAIDEIINEINALPKEADLKLEDKDKINAIKTKYNTLSEAEKGEITNYKALQTLEKRLVVLEKEAAKVFMYSFQVEDKQFPIKLTLVPSNGKQPDITFVSPSQEMFIVEDKALSHKSLVFESEWQEAVGANTPKDVTKDKKDKTETPAALIVTIESADVGVWGLKSNTELTFTAELIEPETTKPEPSSTVEPETKKEKEKPKQSLLDKLLDKKNMNILLYGGGGLILIIVLLIMFLRAKKKKQQQEAEAYDDDDGYDNGYSGYDDDDYEDDYDDAYIEEKPKKQPKKQPKPKKAPPKKRPPAQQPKKRPPAKQEPEDDLTVLDSDMDDIAKIQAEAHALFNQAETNLQETQQQSQKTQAAEEPAYYEDEDDDYSYWPSDDDDITVEEYIDGNMVESADTEEEEETLKKRRSFFPTDDRFD